MNPNPLPYSCDAHQRANQFLVEEAHLLDTQQLDRWLDLLTLDIHYSMPVAVTRVRATQPAARPDGRPPMHHFDEDLHSLRKRVQRFATGHAWTEDPPSRVRHHIGNVRTFEHPNSEVRVESSLLLFRSRGDDRPPEIVSAGRDDVLRDTADGYRLASRIVTVDESVLRTQNLAIFL